MPLWEGPSELSTLPQVRTAVRSWPSHTGALILGLQNFKRQMSLCIRRPGCGICMGATRMD